MSVGQIKQFQYTYNGLTLVVDAIDLGPNGTQFVVHCEDGHADINAIYYNDGDAGDLATLNKSTNALNMNGSGVTWDSSTLLSNAGLGQGLLDQSIASNNDGDAAKATYLEAGDMLWKTISDLDWNNLSNVGIRATSTSGDTGGSIKAVDGDGFDTITPKVKIADAADVVEGQTSHFSLTLEGVPPGGYPYDLYVTYTIGGGDATSGDDYENPSATYTVKFAAGETSKVIDVNTIDDSDYAEADLEHFGVHIQSVSADLPGGAAGEYIDLGASAICVADALGGIIDNDLPPPPPPLDEPVLGLSPGAYKTAENGAGHIPAALDGTSFDDFFNLDDGANPVANRIWADGGQPYTDLTFGGPVNGGNVFAIGEGGQDSTNPDMINGNGELTLAREAATAAANFYSLEIDHNGFVSTLKEALGMDASATDAQVLAELKQEVHDTYESASATAFAQLTAALLSTHEL
jgi:Calx-beta domain